MKNVFVLIFCFSSILMAQDSNTSFKISGKDIKFYKYKNLQLTTSKECTKAINGKLCSELEFLNTVSYKATGRVGTGNENPGTTVCKKLLMGTVLIGEDPDGNQNSFCLLKNDLYVDNGTLFYYAQKNDGVVFKPRGSK